MTMTKITRLNLMLLLTLLMCSIVVLSGITPSSLKAQAPAVTEEDDPDLPQFARGGIDKEEYLRLREEHVSILRGLPYDKQDDRLLAIRDMQGQELANAPGIR